MSEKERWYEFTQREIMNRPFYIRASSLAEARAIRRAHPGGTVGVPDWASNFPDSIEIVGPGKLAPDQDLADNLRKQREGGR